MNALLNNSLLILLLIPCFSFVTLLLAGPECWMSRNNLRIILGEGASIGSGDLLTFKSNVIKERDVPSNLAEFVANVPFNYDFANVRLLSGPVNDS